MPPAWLSENSLNGALDGGIEGVGSHALAPHGLRALTTFLGGKDEDDNELDKGNRFFEEPEVQDYWDDTRKLIARCLLSDWYHAWLGAFVVMSVVTLVKETDAAAQNDMVPSWANVLNWVLIVIYAVELTFRIYIFRSEFFTTGGNIVDFAAVTGDVSVELASYLAGDSYGSLLWLRILRLMRLGRAVRILTMFPELSIMLKCLFGAMKVIFWGMVLLLVSVLIWSILAVQLLNDLTHRLDENGVFRDTGCERCPRAFESTWSAMITLTKHLIAGDSWGEMAVPMIEAEPATALFFFCCLFLGTLAILNLILAMVVDSAMETRNEDHRRMNKLKNAKLLKNGRRLYKLFEDLDADMDGFLSVEELQNGFKDNEEFAAIMGAMDITVDDLDTVFMILDTDKTGAVDYAEFIEQLHKMRSGDSHTLLVFIRCMVAQIKDSMEETNEHQARAAAVARRKMRAVSSNAGEAVRFEDPIATVDGQQPNASGMCRDAAADIESNGFGLRQSRRRMSRSRTVTAACSSILGAMQTRNASKDALDDLPRDKRQERQEVQTKPPLDEVCLDQDAPPKVAKVDSGLAAMGQESLNTDQLDQLPLTNLSRELEKALQRMSTQVDAMHASQLALLGLQSSGIRRPTQNQTAMNIHHNEVIDQITNRNSSNGWKSRSPVQATATDQPEPPQVTAARLEKADASQDVLWSLDAEADAGGLAKRPEKGCTERGCSGADTALEEMPKGTAEEVAAATRLQAMQRGKQARRNLPRKRYEEVFDSQRAGADSATSPSETCARPERWF
jgi:hypothetical protein